MDKNKFLLTYDFKILFCPNLDLKLICKELNVKNLDFDIYKGSLDDIDFYYNIDEKSVNSIVKNIFTGIIGKELDTDTMNWIKDFEKLYKNDNSIIKNKNLAFNYLVFKLELAGFTEKFSLDYINNYYLYKDGTYTFPDERQLAKNIEHFINLKTYWIPNDIDKYKDMEADFFRKVLAYKLDNPARFQFIQFQTHYFNLENQALITHLFKYNNTISYLIKKPRMIVEQKRALLSTYRTLIGGILDYLIKNEFLELTYDSEFKNSLIKSIMRTANLYIESVLNTKDK